MRDHLELDREVAEVGGLSRQELAARWEKTHGSPPPKGINRGLLERSAAWHLQAAKLGGLSAAARAVLRTAKRNEGLSSHSSKTEACEKPSGAATTVAADRKTTNDDRAPVSPATPPLAPGTRLMREWNGRMHVVDVTEQGVLFDGKLYRSLTAVAKRITGTHWSGPRFFGL